MDRLIPFLETKGGVILAFAFSLFLLERLFPAARPLARARLETMSARLMRLAKNVSFAGINAALSPLIVIPLSAFAAQWVTPWRPAWVSGLLIDLIALDIWIYWWHRANHELPLLWRFHEVHHLDQFLDLTTAVRFHFGEVLLSSVVRAAVILALAVPLAHVVVFETLVTLCAVFHHSNVALPPRLERALSFIIVTPSIHWVHHHAVRADTDSNYANILSLWDRVFGSRSRTMRSKDMPIGVEQRTDEGFSRLVIRPFHRVGG